MPREHVCPGVAPSCAFLRFQARTPIARNTHRKPRISNPTSTTQALMSMAVWKAKDDERNFTQCLQLPRCRSESGIEMLSDLSFSAGWKGLQCQQWTARSLDDLGPPLLGAPVWLGAPHGPRVRETFSSVPRSFAASKSASRESLPSRPRFHLPSCPARKGKERLCLDLRKAAETAGSSFAQENPVLGAGSSARFGNAAASPVTTGRKRQCLSPFWVEYAARLVQGETFPGQGA